VNVAVPARPRARRGRRDQSVNAIDESSAPGKSFESVLRSK
jgi:hypothetical protein